MYNAALQLGSLVPKGSQYDLGLASAGLILYAAYFFAACKWRSSHFASQVFLTVATCGALFSCYLLYVLKFILGDFCIVCTGFHVVNFSMFSVAIYEYRDQPSKKSKKL